jgi:hypothetical protein
MKNRVNISKLIREKYREDTISADEFNKIIDSVLQEGLPYWQGKVDTENLEENPNQGQQISYHANGAPGPRNPISNADKNLIPAATIAEQGQSAGQEYTLQVPDIFSMITNSEMEVGDEDKNLIGKIVKNIQPGKGFWRLRVNAINDYVNRNKQNAISEVKDIRSAISSLVMLNVLKKLAFFTAQPGKLFEYVFTPIIGTKAKVVGSTDTSIIDVTKESQGEIWNYSLKFFTGDDSSFVVKGSAKNLKEVVVKNDRPVTYILASAIKEGTKSRIEFAELLISTEFKHFPKSEGWTIKKIYDNGLLLVADGFCGILVIRKEEYDKLVAGGQSQPLQKDIAKRIQGIESGTSSEKTVSGIYFNNKGEPLSTNISKVKENINTIENSFNILKPLISDPEKIKTFLTPSDSSGRGRGIEKPLNQFNTAIGDVIKELAKDKNGAYYNINPIDYLPKLKSLNDEEKITKFNKLISDAENRIAQMKNAIQQPPLKEAKQETINTQQTQDSENKTEKELNFNITLKGSWPLIPNKAILDLGDPNEYNKQQLVMATDLADNIKNTFDAFQKLNTNLVKYFATSKEAIRAAGESDEEFAKNQKATADYVNNAGTAAIENAKTIQDNVSEFQKKENA